MLDLLARQQKVYGDPAPLTVANPASARVDEAFFQNAPKGKTGKKNKK
jgi:hypothetical protein